MSQSPPLSPEVLLLLVNCYKDHALMGERTAKYGECIIDMCNKQIKALDAKLTEVESALSTADAKCERLERELKSTQAQLSEHASRAPLKYVEGSMCSAPEFKKMKSKLENLQAAERARVMNSVIPTTTPTLSPLEDNIADH